MPVHRTFRSSVCSWLSVFDSGACFVVSIAELLPAGGNCSVVGFNGVVVGFGSAAWAGRRSFGIGWMGGGMG